MNKEIEKYLKENCSWHILGLLKQSPGDEITSKDFRYLVTLISDLLKKRDEQVLEKCGKVAWAGDDGFYVKFSDIKTIIATLNTK